MVDDVLLVTALSVPNSIGYDLSEGIAYSVVKEPCCCAAYYLYFLIVTSYATFASKFQLFPGIFLFTCFNLIVLSKAKSQEER